MTWRNSGVSSYQNLRTKGAFSAILTTWRLFKINQKLGLSLHLVAYTMVKKNTSAPL